MDRSRMCGATTTPSGERCVAASEIFPLVVRAEQGLLTNPPRGTQGTEPETQLCRNQGQETLEAKPQETLGQRPVGEP